MNFIKVNTKNSKAKDAYTKARDEHNAAIASLKQQRKEARKAIKLHRLLKRQARNLYKITKLEP